ncbi:hypothetical protein BSKO_01031 [Bryopsis sp. KO-2023]|nr:hypothetical protein BSKO_01031 [Bryopsis sp. KO-2023]
MDAEFQEALGDESVSNQELFDGLTSISPEEDVFVLNTAAAVAGTTKRMQMILDGKGDRVAFHLLVELIRAIPADVPPEITQSLLNEEFLGALGQAFNYFLKIQAPGVDEALSAVLRCVQDLSYLLYRDTNKQNVLGKTRCGEFFVERVLALFDKRGSLPPMLGRQATSTLLDLITSSKCNQTKMVKQEKHCKTLFEDYLPTCGDYSMQIDIVEIMYRCSLSKTANFDSVLPEKVRDCFDDLVRKPPKGIDLGAELRSVLFLYNSSLEKFASVHMFEAISISMGEMVEGIKIANQWMNVGSEHVSVYVSHEDDDPDVPPDVLDIFYDNIEGHSLKEVGGKWELRLVCKEAPTSMHFRIEQEEFRILILLSKADVLHLSKLVPGLQVPGKTGKNAGKFPKVSWALNAKCSALSFSNTFTAHRGSSNQTGSPLDQSKRNTPSNRPTEPIEEPHAPEKPSINPSLEVWKGKNEEISTPKRRSTLAKDRKSAQKSGNSTIGGEKKGKDNAGDFLEKRSETVIENSGKACNKKLLECLSGDGGPNGVLDKKLDGGSGDVKGGKACQSHVDGKDGIMEIDKKKHVRWDPSRQAKTDTMQIEDKDASAGENFQYVPLDPPSKKGGKNKKGKKPKKNQLKITEKGKKTPDRAPEVQPTLVGEIDMDQPTLAGEFDTDACKKTPCTKANTPSTAKKGNVGIRTYGLRARGATGEQSKPGAQDSMKEKRDTACLTEYLRPSKRIDRPMEGKPLRKSLIGVLEPSLGKVLQHQPERDDMQGVENEGSEHGGLEAADISMENVESVCDDDIGEIDSGMDPAREEREEFLKKRCGVDTGKKKPGNVGTGAMKNGDGGPDTGKKKPGNVGTGAMKNGEGGPDTGKKKPGNMGTGAMKNGDGGEEEQSKKCDTVVQPYEFVSGKKPKKVRKQGTGKASRKGGKSPKEEGKCVGVQTEGIECEKNEIETRSVGICTDENMDASKFTFKLGDHPERSHHRSGDGFLTPEIGRGVSLGAKEFRMSSSENEQEGMGNRKPKVGNQGLWRELNALGRSSGEESENLTPAWKAKINTPAWMQGKKRPLALNLAEESDGAGNNNQDNWADLNHGKQGFIGKDAVPTPSRSQGKQTTKSTFYQVETLTHGSGGVKMDNSAQGEMPNTPGESFIRRVHFRSQECMGDDDISMGNCGSDIEALKRALGTSSDFNSTPMPFHGQGVGGSALNRKDTGGNSTGFRLGGANEISSEEGGTDVRPTIGRLGYGDDDEIASTDQEFELLGHVVKKMLKSKRENARQNQRAILQDVQSRLGESDRKLQVQIKRDAAALSTACQEGFYSMTKKLEDLNACIEGIRNKLQVDLERLAEDAKELRDQTKQAGQSIHTAVEKKRSNLKRKMEQMKEGHLQMLEEAETKIKKTRSRASKVPELATILKNFM